MSRSLLLSLFVVALTPCISQAQDSAAPPTDADTSLFGEEVAEEFAKENAASDTAEDTGDMGADFNEGAELDPPAARETMLDEPEGPALKDPNADRAPKWLVDRLELAVDRLLKAEARVAELEKQVDEMNALVQKVEALEIELAAVKQQDNKVLGRMADDPVLRTELGRVVQGRLNLVNNLGTSKVVYINGTAWTVRTGESYIYVPVGKVSIQQSQDANPEFIDMEEWTDKDGQLETEYIFSRQERSVMKAR